MSNEKRYYFGIKTQLAIIVFAALFYFTTILTLAAELHRTPELRYSAIGGGVIGLVGMTWLFCYWLFKPHVILRQDDFTGLKVTTLRKYKYGSSAQTRTGLLKYSDVSVVGIHHIVGLPYYRYQSALKPDVSIHIWKDIRKADECFEFIQSKLNISIFSNSENSKT